MNRFQSFLTFFFGTPRRLRASLIGLGIVLLMIPGVSGFVTARLLDALGPLLTPLVVILLLGLGFRKILGPVFRAFSPSKKKS